ncbi:class I adenylate-forming enzyme family protein [Nocardia callitridis]|uniref:Long-chain fatty acid--CoA ligase n=1 Tax=Nocardia callitridis TaxID=648753 RepID=A0ABP9KM94_9NOCA
MHRSSGNDGDHENNRGTPDFVPSAKNAPASPITVPRPVADMLRRTLATHPDAPAIEAASGTWSYAELDDRADHAAGALWGLGVRPGDRVAACLPNDLDIVAAFHGTQRIGALWAGIGEAMTEGEQQRLTDLCAPTVVLAGTRCTVRTPHRIDLDRWTELVADADQAPSVTHDIDAPAAIAFTSGTSGQPKAVVHSQRNLLMPGAALAAQRGWGADLRKGDSFPLTILNLIVLSTLLTAQTGGCAVLMDRRDVEGVAQWIRDHQVTVWNGAPAQLYDLARRPDLTLPSLREVWSGGADTSETLRQMFADTHGLVPRVTYGLTEAPAVVSIDPPGSACRAGTSGRLLAHYDVAAYDDNDRRLPPGEVGELRLAGAGSGGWRPMLGHWDGGRVVPVGPGPLRTGDIGTVDRDGWLTVIDRKKLVIIRGGANVYPLEVERVLATRPALTRVAVFPVPDDRLGQRVAAVVETTDTTVDFAALADVCARELAPYKVPELWARLDHLPLNAMGKVVRTDLLALTEGHRVARPRRTP